MWDGLPASYGQRKSRLTVEKAETVVFYTEKLVKLQMKLEFQKLMVVATNIWLLFCLDIQIDKIVSFNLIPGFAYPRRNNETAWSWLQIGVKNLLFEHRFFVQPIVQLAEKCCVKKG